MRLADKVKVQIRNGDVDTSDVKVNSRNRNVLPLLVLTDDFVNNKKINEVTVTSTEPSNKPYYSTTDEDGNVTNTDLTFLLELTTSGGRHNVFYHDDRYNTLISIPLVTDIETKYWKDREININSVVYGYSKYTQDSFNLTFMNDDTNYSLPKPTASLNSVKIIDLSIRGIKTNNPVHRVKTSQNVQEYIDMDIVTVIEINTADIGWDNALLPLFTILQDTEVTHTLKYIGSAKVDKVYIPLP